MSMTAAEKFLGSVEKLDNGCWEWRGYCNEDGYGVFTHDGVRRYAHRFAYETWIGPIPDGLELDHAECENPPCINPYHLEPITHAENVRRGNSPSAINARKTHCLRGHEFGPENTYTNPRGDRNCRTCKRIRDGYKGGLPFAQRTHCKRGHEYSSENTYTDPRGWRQCRVCNRVRRERQPTGSTGAGGGQ